MKKSNMLVAALALATLQTAQAGGILTNTNQSVDFLRNPARDAAISLDGVYSNPAGVAFMPEGFHLAFNWQYAHQTRTVGSVNPLYALGRKNNGRTEKVFEGVADAPCIPSVQAAWNKGNWSVQFNFSVPGGGGKCDFADGLGSFESVVGGIAQKFMQLDQTATQLNALTARLAPIYASPIAQMAQVQQPGDVPNYEVGGYDMDGYMQGRQYYFGFQLGTAYKLLDNLSIYGGLRLLYGTATYKAKINNIMVKTGVVHVDFEDFLPNVPTQAQQAAQAAQSHLALINAYEKAGMPMSDELLQARTQLQQGLQALATSREEMGKLAKYAQGVNLLCNQTSLGVAPVVGVDYQVGRFNFAAKYEFKTQIRMKNESTVNEASEIAAVNKFRDGEKVNEDAPAMLTVGAQWNPIDPIRLNLGAHLFFDKDANWYGNSQELLDHNSYEVLAGAEWDISDRLTVSLGGQLTRYGLTDDYMNDMSFVVNSYSIGFGGKYQVSDCVKVQAAYFQTNYGHYDRVRQTEPMVSDSFTRTNRVLGLGVELTF